MEKTLETTTNHGDLRKCQFLYLSTPSCDILLIMGTPKTVIGLQSHAASAWVLLEIWVLLELCRSSTQKGSGTVAEAARSGVW